MRAATPWRVALLAITAARLVVAARMPLSADESYYWVWSHALAPGYLDHPPMVALWIRLGTILAGQTPLGIRLLGPLSALAGSLLLARAADDLAPGRNAGTIAAALLNATLLLNVGSVVMTPDTPLLLFWTAALAASARLVQTGRPWWWLGVGLASGLALDSKYTAVLLAPSLLAWVVLMRGARPWLQCWQLWAGAALALALFSPVIAWNASHGWASFAKQGGRTGDWAPWDAIRFLGELVGGQAGLATPLVFVLFCLGTVGALRAARRGDVAAGLVAALVLVPAAVFVEHALGGRVQANWPAIVAPAASIAAARWASRLWRPAAALGLAMAAAVFAQAVWAPLVLPRWADFTLIRLAGWDDVAGAAFVARLHERASFVTADEYGLASELAFRLGGEVLGAEPRWRLFGLPPAQVQGQVGILVRSTRDLGDPDPGRWGQARLLGTVSRERHGVVAETYRLWRVVGVCGPAVALPHAEVPVFRAD